MQPMYPIVIHDPVKSLDQQHGLGFINQLNIGNREPFKYRVSTAVLMDPSIS